MNQRRIGTKYEARAAEYLEGKGCRILEKNFRCRIGEIDLIAQDKGCLVFVEVKYRADASCGSPQEAVDARKQARILRAAQYYLLRHGYGTETECRFDVVAIQGSELTHIENAFGV